MGVCRCEQWNQSHSRNVRRGYGFLSEEPAGLWYINHPTQRLGRGPISIPLPCRKTRGDVLTSTFSQVAAMRRAMIFIRWGPTGRTGQRTISGIGRRWLPSEETLNNKSCESRNVMEMQRQSEAAKPLYALRGSVSILGSCGSVSRSWSRLRKIVETFRALPGWRAAAGHRPAVLS